MAHGATLRLIPENMAPPDGQKAPGRRALIVVLADLERSPRMQRHAVSFANAGWLVDLLGFGTWRHDGIDVHAIPSFQRVRGAGLWFAPAAALRQFLLAFALIRALARVPRPDVVLVATPPAFPSLPLVAAFVRFWRARLIIDWHNLTAAMLRLRTGDGLLVRLAGLLERLVARSATAHLAASQALGAHLRFPQVRVLRDAVTADFLSGELSHRGEPVVIAPTSWGPDEDLSVVTEAASILDRREGARISILITGMGERRRAFEDRLAAMSFRRVMIRTAWLEEAEYRRALAGAALGLSLHRSASGLDLANKVAEMLACRIPVCALDSGPLLSEQIFEGVNGVTFSNADELADRLEQLLGRWPDTSMLDRLRASIEPAERWEPAWRRIVEPLLG